MQTIYLDISNKGVISCIQAKQNEVGRKFLAVITDSGVPYEIQNNSVVSVWYEGASGEGNYTDVGGKPAISVSKNKVTVELIEQMLSVPGNGIITVLINSVNGDQIGLWNIDYCVEKVAGVESEKAEEYYTAFSQSAASLAQSAETIGKTQERIDSIIKAKNATAAGIIYPLASSKVPSGFLLCDGAEYSRTEYLELFEAIGTIYGEGDGETTFNVPNLSTRVPVGKGNGFDLGNTGGEAEHILLESEMPSHTHKPSTIATPDPLYPEYGFQLTTPLPSSFTARAKISSGEDYFAIVSNVNQDTNNIAYSLQTAATGGSEPHNIMQPYIVVNYIISTGKEVEFVVGGTVGATTTADAVLYTEQSLTTEQQSQARANIGAAAVGEGGGGEVWETINEAEVEDVVMTELACNFDDYRKVAIMFDGFGTSTAGKVNAHYGYPDRNTTKQICQAIGTTNDKRQGYILIDTVIGQIVYTAKCNWAQSGENLMTTVDSLSIRNHIGATKVKIIAIDSSGGGAVPSATNTMMGKIKLLGVRK